MANNNVNKSVNNYNGKFEDQRWLAAHNAWNTESNPNQCKTITELLDYGVRGFALDILGDDEISLHLQHGGDLLSVTKWKKILDELDAWLTNNPKDIVTLFFESYLSGPGPGITAPALQALDNSLSRIACYKSGLYPQVSAMLEKTLQELVDGNHRLFAFIEKQPDEGNQTVFPTMRSVIAENVYGDESLKKTKWVNSREESDSRNPLTFMNHFGNTPSGSEWTRNRASLIVKHAEAFMFSYGGRYPNFISLDYINWNNSRRGPIAAIETLMSRKDFTGGLTRFHWKGSNDFDNIEIDIDETQKIVDFRLKTDPEMGIMKIKPIRGEGEEIVRIEVLNSPGRGIVDIRFITKGKKSSYWLLDFQRNNSVHTQLGKHVIDGELYGIFCRTQKNCGVTDFAAAFRKQTP